MLPRRNIAANYAGQVWSAAISLVFTPVYLQALGTEAYGLIGFFVVLLAWFALLDLGLSGTVMREMARGRAGALPPTELGDLMRSIEWIVLCVAALIVGIIALGAPWIESHWIEMRTLSSQEVRDALVVMGLAIAARFCESVYRGALYGLNEHVFYNVVLVVFSTLRAGGTALAVSWQPNLVVFFACQFLGALGMLAVLFWRTHAMRPAAGRTARFSLPALRRVGRFAGGLSLATLLGLVFSQLDKLFLSSMVSLDRFGLYMLAVTLISLFAVISGPVGSALSPRLAVLVATNDVVGTQAVFTQGTALVSAIAGAVLAVLLIVPETVLWVWIGDAPLAAEGAAPLALLAVGAYCNAVSVVPYCLQIAHGWAELSVRLNMAGIVLLVPGLWIGYGALGLTGAALAVAGVSCLMLVAGMVLTVRRLLPHHFARAFAIACLLPLGAACLPVLVLDALMAVALGGGVPPSRGVGLALLAACGMSALAAGMAATAAGRAIAVSALRAGLIR